MGYAAYVMAMAVFAQDAGAADQLPTCQTEGRVIASEAVSFPPTGEVSEVEIGQSMVSASRRNVQEAGIALTAPVTFRGRYLIDGFTVTIPPQALTPLEDGGFMPAEWEYRFNMERRPRTGIGRPDIRIVKDGEGLRAILRWALSTKGFDLTDAHFASERCVAVGRDSFRRELIYGGVSQGTVSIDYREFVDDFARPAFSQTLRYDLSDGREIGFRGARFEILEANNTSIRYRVIRPLE